ncbi:hypothetical protein [Burkholderia ubonensis]|uniref:hypothetical protein n=1 Tax=Burkholderia ubonensis TaxID=101571 RepID=UPI0012FBF2F2|nr:hypothetical protein [Burkholderia ubonensis]
MSQMANSFVNAACKSDTLAAWVGACGTILAVVAGIAIGQIQIYLDRRHRANDRMRTRLYALNVLCWLVDEINDEFARLRKQVSDPDAITREMIENTKGSLLKRFDRVDRFMDSVPIAFFSGTAELNCTASLQRWVSGLRREINSIELALVENSLFMESLAGCCDQQFDEARKTREILQQRFRRDNFDGQRR